MDQVSVTAASGLQSRMEALDLVANNLANTTTGGFKLDREFYSLFTAADNEADGSATRLPLIQKQWTDFSQGVLTPTGNALDLALSGKGFFAVNGPNGPLYTRNGSFQLSPSGQLTTADGYAVRDTGGQPIQTQSQAPIEVGEDGSVTQSGQTLGQLQIGILRIVRCCKSWGTVTLCPAILRRCRFLPLKLRCSKARPRIQT